MLSPLDVRDLRGDLAASLPRPRLDGAGPVEVVSDILEAVRTGGDAAVLGYTEQLDGVRLDRSLVSDEEIDAAWAATDDDTIAALEFAERRIREYHETQLHEPAVYDRGGSIRSFASPVAAAGCYVPGGRAAYPSTVLMTAVPARVAGVSEVVVCVPPDRATGGVAPVTLAACRVAGVDRVYAVGGAQAVAALAYGTEEIAPVDVICGPGNRYVAIAKRQVADVVGIAAAFAGPSEVVVIADDSVDPTLAAVDVIVQAEHGPDGLAWLISWDPAVLDRVNAEIARLVAESPRAADITATLDSAGYAVRCRDAAQALEVSNAIAPEHLELLVAAPESMLPGVRNAGAIFCGPWSPASFGDYVAGPSHVLPTSGTARFASALTVADFQRHHHVITFDEAQAAAIAPHVEALATAEGLDAHALSARLRRGDR